MMRSWLLIVWICSTMYRSSWEHLWSTQFLAMMRISLAKFCPEVAIFLAEVMSCSLVYTRRNERVGSRWTTPPQVFPKKSAANGKHPKLARYNLFQPWNEHIVAWSKTVMSRTSSRGFKTRHSRLARSLFSLKPQNEVVQAHLSVGTAEGKVAQRPGLGLDFLHRSCGLQWLRESFQQPRGRDKAPKKGQVWGTCRLKEVLAWPKGQRPIATCRASQLGTDN